MKYLEIKAFYLTDQPIGMITDLSSAIRGLWGRGLHKIYCYQKQLECSECPLENCTYYVLFEKQLSSSDQYHPYIIQSRVISPYLIEAKFKFFGWVCDHLEKLLYSIINTNNMLLKREGNSYRLTLQKIEDLNSNQIYSADSEMITRPTLKMLYFRPEEVPLLEITFTTPLRQKHQGKLMSEFMWEPFAKSLINRIRFINEHFNRNELNIPEQINLDGVEIKEANTYWSEKIRVSFRQESKMSIGGLLGSVVLANVSPEMIGMLKLGRYLHTGKQCTFGNGEFALRNLSENQSVTENKSTPSQNKEIYLSDKSPP